jgi:hypothetical protein
VSSRRCESRFMKPLLLSAVWAKSRIVTTEQFRYIAIVSHRAIQKSQAHRFCVGMGKIPLRLV